VQNLSTRKYATKTTIVPILALLALSFAIPLASVHATNNAAVVISNLGCGMLDGSGGSVSATGSQFVATSNGNGLFTCSVSGVLNPTGHAVIWSFAIASAFFGFPFYCGGYSLGVTNDWHETVSASGQATLSCHFNPS